MFKLSTIYSKMSHRAKHDLFFFSFKKCLFFCYRKQARRKKWCSYQLAACLGWASGSYLSKSEKEREKEERKRKRKKREKGERGKRKERERAMKRWKRERRRKKKSSWYFRRRKKWQKMQDNIFSSNRKDSSPVDGKKTEETIWIQKKRLPQNDKLTIEEKKNLTHKRSTFLALNENAVLRASFNFFRLVFCVWSENFFPSFFLNRVRWHLSFFPFFFLSFLFPFFPLSSYSVFRRVNSEKIAFIPLPMVRTEKSSRSLFPRRQRWRGKRKEILCREKIEMREEAAIEMTNYAANEADGGRRRKTHVKNKLKKCLIPNFVFSFFLFPFLFSFFLFSVSSCAAVVAISVFIFAL